MFRVILHAYLEAFIRHSMFKSNLETYIFYTYKTNLTGRLCNMSWLKASVRLRKKKNQFCISFLCYNYIEDLKLNCFIRSVLSSVLKYSAIATTFPKDLRLNSSRAADNYCKTELFRTAYLIAILKPFSKYIWNI